MHLVTVEGPHGSLQFNSETGRVIIRKCQASSPYIWITMFDIRAFKWAFGVDIPERMHISEIGYWTSDGELHEAKGE